MSDDKINKIDFENLDDFDFNIRIDDNSKKDFYETLVIDFKCFDRKNDTRIYAYLYNSNSLYSAIRLATIRGIFIKECEYQYRYKDIRTHFEELLITKAKCLANNNEEFYKGVIDLINDTIETHNINKRRFIRRDIFPRDYYGRETFYFSDNLININKNEKVKTSLEKIKTGNIVKQVYGEKIIFGIMDYENKYARQYKNSDGEEYTISFPKCIILSENNLCNNEYIESFKPDMFYGNSITAISKSNLKPAQLELYNKISRKFGFKEE